jgi:hypothetical protein
VGDRPFPLTLLAKKSLLISTLEVYPAHKVMDYAKSENSYFPFLLFVHEYTLLFVVFPSSTAAHHFLEGHSSVGCIKHKEQPPLYGPANRVPATGKEKIKGGHQTPSP